MGYRSAFQIQFVGCTTEEARAMLSKQLGHDSVGYVKPDPDKKGGGELIYIHEVKWYHWLSDLEAITRANEHVAFVVTRSGERFLDIDRACACRGVVQLVKASISFYEDASQPPLPDPLPRPTRSVAERLEASEDVPRDEVLAALRGGGA